MYNIVQEKMNPIETPTPTLTPKQKKQIANKKYYHKRYATHPIYIYIFLFKTHLSIPPQ
jgi:hypothetical protein